MSYEKYNIDFPATSEFKLNIAYNTPTNFSVSAEPPSHIHNGFEIYFNISGNVSFIVESRTYPILPGDIIFTKPYEYHHCIYHDNTEHEHYCLEFSGNEECELFAPLNKIEKGVGNHVRLTEEAKSAFRRHIDALRLDKNLSSLDKYYHFIRILQILTSQTPSVEEEHNSAIPQNLKDVLSKISDRYGEPLSVEGLASEFFVSVNTLERYFREHLGITPSEYIKRKRISEAMLLLNGQISVAAVAYKCGFSNTSNFIKTFKREVGITPYKYMKSK